MALSGNSVVSILREVCVRLHRGLPVYPVGTTTAEGSTTTLVDTDNLTDAEADSRLLGRPWIRVDSGTNAGRVLNATLTGFAGSTGTITFGPALGSNFGAGVQYSIWRYIHPRMALQYLKEVLRDLRYEEWVPISEAADANMEASDTAAFSATNATLLKETSAAFVHDGAQSLKMVDNGGVPQFSLTSNINVRQAELWVVSVTAKVAQGSLSVWPLTGESTPSTAGQTATSDEADWMELIPGAELTAIPASHEVMNIVVQGSNPGTAYIDNVHIWNTRKRIWTLPSWVLDPAHVRRVGYFPRGRNLAGTSAFSVDDTEFQPWPWRPLKAQEPGAHPFRIELGGSQILRPLWAVIDRAYDVSSLSDTTTVTADFETVVKLVLHKCYTQLLEEATDETDARKWLARKRELGEAAALRASLIRHGQQFMRVTVPDMPRL